MANHVIGKRRLREAEAEFQEFTMKARCAPTWMSGTHLLDQVLDFGRHRRSTMTNSAFPFPIQPKALAVPSDDGLRFHNAQGERQLGQTLESQTQTSRSQDRNRRRRFWCTRGSKKEADDGVPGSPRAERPEFEGCGEGRRAGKRGVRTFPGTLPRLAASSTPSISTDFLVGTA